MLSVVFLMIWVSSVVLSWLLNIGICGLIWVVMFVCRIVMKVFLIVWKLRLIFLILVFLVVIFCIVYLVVVVILGLICVLVWGSQVMVRFLNLVKGFGIGRLF